MEKCRRMKRPQCTSRIGKILTVKVLEDTPAVLSLDKLCDENGYSYESINGQKPHLIKKRDSDTVQQNSIRIQCNTENFLPILFSGLSANSSFSFPSSTSITPSRQEIDHPTSSSSSSTSPTMTVSSDSENRAKADMRGTDSNPASVSSSQVEELIQRWDPLFAVKKPTQNPKIKNENHEKERGDPLHSDIPETVRLTRQFLSWSIFGAYTHTPVLIMKYLWSLRPREVWIWVNTVLILTSRKTELPRSASGPKLRGLRAEDAKAKPYLVLKILVTW